MRVLGGDYLPGAAAGERRDHLASVFCAGFLIPVIRFALMLHSFAAVALIVVIMVHIYAALWVKGTITAMVEGWVTKTWAKKHHPRWYREVREKQEKHLSIRNPASELFERETAAYRRRFYSLFDSDSLKCAAGGRFPFA
jgi:hypothetical protein